jgi:hypothetical protein
MMNQIRKHLPTLRAAALLWIAFLLSGITAQVIRRGSDSFARIDDDSDWWSIIRANSEHFHLKPQNLDTDTSNFQIDGVAVGDDELPKIVMKLGKAITVSRGDAATARSQICYLSADESEKVHLIFESGEVQYAFYLFADGPGWTGGDLCVKSQSVTTSLRAASGLRLGLTPSQVESILGKPTVRKNDKLAYFRQFRKRNSIRDLQRLRQAHSDLNEKEFQENYDFYYLTVYIEARFSGSKLSYLGLSMSETT